MEGNSFVIDSRVLRHLVHQFGVEIPNREDYPVFVRQITEALQKTDLGIRESWDRREMTIEVSNVFAGVYQNYVNILSHKYSAVAHASRYRFQSDIEHQLLIFFIKQKEWGSIPCVFSCLVKQIPALSTECGMDSGSVLRCLDLLFEEAIASYPRWRRRLFRLEYFFRSILSISPEDAVVASYSN